MMEMTHLSYFDSLFSNCFDSVRAQSVSTYLTAIAWPFERYLITYNKCGIY